MTCSTSMSSVDRMCGYCDLENSDFSMRISRRFPDVPEGSVELELMHVDSVVGERP